ncbi:hypothetical protein Asi03nite_07830 [Actinoplanes siamensis]|uniref:Uncharacterized protein n=1 Tax=Actinoplanes siamensis TaxID=1223317 RepID=A0A919KB17_9ACTN|nr:hypothetical protein Asi03nite_07830 [Actinoplanes siamensis]
MTVSAKECAASDSIAADPEISPATSFATAMTRFASSASSTVPTLSVSARGSVPGSPAGVVRGSGAIVTTALVPRLRSRVTVRPPGLLGFLSCRALVPSAW